MQVYHRIRDLREDNDMTQQEVADKLFIQREVYRRYETGTREIPFNIAIMIAKLYNVSLDYIAELTNEKQLNIKNETLIYQEHNGTATINILILLLQMI